MDKLISFIRGLLYGDTESPSIVALYYPEEKFPARKEEWSDEQYSYYFTHWDIFDATEKGNPVFSREGELVFHAFYNRRTKEIFWEDFEAAR